MNRMKRLRELRQQNGFTQQLIAKKLNIKQNTYSQYESGSREIPLQALKALAMLYDTSVDYIIGLTDYEQPYPRSEDVSDDC